MGNGFICLDSDSYRKIKKLREENTISNKFYFEIEDVKNFKQLFNTIKKYINISSEKECQKIFWKIYRTRTGLDRIDPDMNRSLNSWQSDFLIYLIQNGGIITREDCLKNILHDQQIKNQVFILMELDIIISITTRRVYGGKTIFMINPKLLKESD